MLRKPDFISYQFRPALEGAAIAAGLLTAEHLGLYRFRGRLPLPARYALGVAALGIGLAHACRERGDMRPVYDGLTITAIGGALVTGAHGIRYLAWTRRRRPTPQEALDAAVYRRARLGGA